ncbi:phosphodiester glycosidase family protein, partial [Patescibacteria group bacterium]|nr:phosphodiester glycosidase family protein [Patescibacteria group bacterium]MBU1868038.1 phosphodiester glycosidase family protein [Patescibacteria group bacterium]
LATTEIQNQIPSWGEKFLNQKFDELLNTINSSSSTLDQEYQTLLAEQAAAERAQQQPTPTTAPALSTQLTKGYAQISVSTERGIFIVNLIKHPLNEIRVLTLTANNENCANNCPTKSLAQYVSENSGFAGIHGSYFCPPDYATCTNKTNSYDFAVYNSALGKWLNENSLGWTNMGLLTFAETQASLQNFYVYEPEYTTPSVTAAIQNYPSLVYNNQIVAGNFNLTSYQETKGYRGAIGFNNTTLFLAITSNTSVSDLAYVMKALGASYSLNLDGGGSSAMYYQGSYRVGPGRSLPNAIVLQNR